VFYIIDVLLLVLCIFYFYCYVRYNGCYIIVKVLCDFDMWCIRCYLPTCPIVLTTAMDVNEVEVEVRWLLSCRRNILLPSSVLKCWLQFARPQGFTFRQTTLSVLACLNDGNLMP
jgi:hypothetical protein